MKIQRQKESFSWRMAGYGDDEWEAHRQKVEDVLRQLYEYRDEKGQLLDNRRAFGNVSPKGDHYEPTDADRKMLYNQALEIMRETGGPGNRMGLKDIPRDRSALLMAGIGGAGKGTILNHPSFGPYLGNTSHFIVNPDDTKLVMARLGMIPDADELRDRYGIVIPGYEDLSPMERSPFVHEEASWLTKELARQLHNEGYNIIHDGTLGRQKKVDSLTAELRGKGYTPEEGGRVNAALVDQDVNEGLQRAGFRHRGGQNKYLQLQQGPYDIDHPRPQIGPGDEDFGDQGGRALPQFIHAENNAPPGSRARSAPADLFPYTQTKTDSSIIFDGLYPRGGTPDILGGHGPDYADLIPPDRMRRFGRQYMSASSDEITVRDIVHAFEDGEIDLGGMVNAIANRLSDIVDDEPRGYYDNTIASADDVLYWLDDAIDNGSLSQEDREKVMTVLRPILFG